MFWVLTGFLYTGPFKKPKKGAKIHHCNLIGYCNDSRKLSYCFAFKSYKKAKTLHFQGKKSEEKKKKMATTMSISELDDETMRSMSIGAVFSDFVIFHHYFLFNSLLNPLKINTLKLKKSCFKLLIYYIFS